MTQAVNLANFANNLDSSGGMNPSALNAAVTVSKGGTGATTAAGARTALGVDYVTLGGLMYPVGSIYINASSATNPATLLGFGTWVAFGAGRVPVGVGGGFTAGSTGGSADAVVVSHDHSGATDHDGLHNHAFQAAIDGGGVYNLGTGATFSISSTLGTAVAGDHNHTFLTNTTGVSGVNANLQPYIVVYMWQRTA